MEETVAYAPVALFVYNRPEHTKKTLEALQQNIGADQTVLYVFCDYAKNPDAVLNMQKTRDYVHTITGFKEIHITERSNNLGLAKSIITGTTEVVNRHGKIIVLEDDLITDKYFLTYMNDALTKYQNEKKVFSITGYSHFPKGNPKLPESYFLKVFSSWGWATWSDRWALFDEQALGWEKTKTDHSLAKAFDYEGCFYNCQMLYRQMEEHSINSWAIRAYWTQFCNDMLTLFPNHRLLENEGFDGSGEHCNLKGDYLDGVLAKERVTRFPEVIEEQGKSREELIKFITKKKRIYKLKRIPYYLKNPAQAIAKLKEKLSR